MSLRRSLSSRPAGGRISQGMSPLAERQAQQRQARQPQDGNAIAFDEYGRQTIVPADGIQLLGMTFGSPPSAADAQTIASKVDELIYKLTDGGFLDEEVGNQGGATAAPDGATTYTETFGDNSNTTFTITHSLGTQDITSVLIYEVSSGDLYVPDITLTDANNIALDFGSTTPTSNQFRIVVSSA